MGTSRSPKPSTPAQRRRKEVPALPDELELRERGANTWTASQAAIVLQLTDRRVRQLVSEGKLSERRDPQGALYFVPREVNELRSARKLARRPDARVSKANASALGEVEVLRKELGELGRVVELRAVTSGRIEEDLRRELAQRDTQLDHLGRRVAQLEEAAKLAELVVPEPERGRVRALFARR
jgi:hypothetical protein